MTLRTFDLHDLANRANIWFVKHRRWWIEHVDPIGPSEPMITEAGEFMEMELSIDVMVTEGA